MCATYPDMSADDPNDSGTDPFERILVAHLQIVAQVLIARGLTISRVTEVAKRAMLEAVLAQHGDEISDSRVSLLTGLHRKDVRRLRANQLKSVGESGLNAVARAVTRWLTDPDFQDGEGQPRDLARNSEDGVAGLDELARRSKADMASGTLVRGLLDGGTMIETERGHYRLVTEAALPKPGSDQQLDAYSKTIGAHLQAATQNLLADPDQARFFERALRYSHLSEAALEELDQEARQGAADLIKALNLRAQELQERDETGDHRGTFTLGVYALPDHKETS